MSWFFVPNFKTASTFPKSKDSLPASSTGLSFKKIDGDNPSSNGSAKPPIGPSH